MKINDSIVILLTACVNPRGMVYTVLQDSDERKNQYITSLQFYLTHTSCHIVFVENSNSNFSDMFTEYIKSGRLEFFCFDGNNYDRTKGKGYGEALIIKYAYDHSTSICKANYVIKITGRLIISNIQSLLSSRFFKLKNVCRCDFRWNDYLWSMVLIVPSSFLRNTIISNINRINDSEHCYFEHIVYESMIKNKVLRIIPFLDSPIIMGTCGTSNQIYTELISKNQLMDNFRLSARFYRKRGQHVYAFFYFFVFVIIKLYRTINSLKS